MEEGSPLSGLPALAVARELAPRAGPSAKEDAFRAQVSAILTEVLRGDSGVTVTQGGQTIIVSGAALSSTLNQLVESAVITGGFGRTFYARGNGTANIGVSAGAVGSVIVPETTFASPTDGTLIWLWVEIDSGGTVTDAEVRSGSSIPADTSTQGHKPLATVTVTSSIATPVPVGWNWSDVQRCGGVWLWGGMAS